MLSEAEQRRLSEIEAQLRADDPTFVQDFDGRWQRRPRPGRLMLLAVIVTAATVGIGMVAGSAGIAVAVATTCASAGVWITHGQRP
jgi:H+/Cl- antiporter ClcA